MDNTMLRIPIRATMRKIDGEWKMVDAEYADIPADVIARKILAAFGVAITGEKGKQPPEN